MDSMKHTYLDDDDGDWTPVEWNAEVFREWLYVGVLIAVFIGLTAFMRTPPTPGTTGRDVPPVVEKMP